MTGAAGQAELKKVDGCFDPGWGSVICLRLWVSRSPWRIGAAWAVVAGAMIGGVSLGNGTDMLRLVGAIWLADSAWGAIWSLVAGRAALHVAKERSLPLPYAQPDAPLSTLIRRIAEAVAGEGWRELAASLALVLGLAFLLGKWALLLSAIALAVATCGHLLARSGRPPLLCHALLAIALPWTLGAMLGEGLAPARLPTVAALAGAFVLLEWGIQRLRGDRTTAVWVGQFAVVAALAGLRFAGAAAVAAALLLLPSLWLLRLRGGETVGSRVADLGAVWWWASLVITALTVRLTWL